VADLVHGDGGAFPIAGVGLRHEDDVGGLKEKERSEVHDSKEGG
jgi:hypothetical protein